MANVNLKTDFKNGETLFDYQLNNNFKAIEAALAAMNAIVWQDNADKVVTFRGTTEELMNREIIDGQILYDTTTGESYIDYLGKRISTGSGNAIHIGDTEPTNASTQLWIDRDDLSTVGSEVVNSLEGNEERMSPSVAAVNKSNTYSTEETFTGKYWIDGKKIYRKVIITEGIVGNNSLISHNISDLKMCVDRSIFANTGKTTYMEGNPIFMLALNKIDETNIDINISDAFSKWKIHFTLEYTKTTNIVEESEE